MLTRTPATLRRVQPVAADPAPTTPAPRPASPARAPVLATGHAPRQLAFAFKRP